MTSVRLSLTARFVIGSLFVAAATSLLPDLARQLGISFSAWGTLFVALGVGGATGFFLSRMLAVKFDKIRAATVRIREGDLCVELGTRSNSRLTDEVDDLAMSLEGMLLQLRQLVSRVQKAIKRSIDKEGLRTRVAKLEALRADALATIRDKSIYPDANHGAAGQPVVDQLYGVVLHMGRRDALRSNIIYYGQYQYVTFRIETKNFWGSHNTVIALCHFAG